MTDDPYHAGEIGGYVVASNAPISDDARRAAMDLIEAASSPMPPGEVLRELTRLRALTVSRSATDEDVAMQLAAYADALAEYPGDAVRGALRQWPKANKFWPALAEIISIVGQVSNHRDQMATAIRSHRPVTADPPRPLPTQSEIAAVSAMLRAAGIPASNGRGQILPHADLSPSDLPQRLRRVARETASFRLPPPDDPAVLQMLRNMLGAPPQAEAAE